MVDHPARAPWFVVNNVGDPDVPEPTHQQKVTRRRPRVKLGQATRSNLGPR